MDSSEINTEVKIHIRNRYRFLNETSPLCTNYCTTAGLKIMSVKLNNLFQTKLFLFCCFYNTLHTQCVQRSDRNTISISASHLLMNIYYCWFYLKLLYLYKTLGVLFDMYNVLNKVLTGIHIYTNLMKTMGPWKSCYWPWKINLENFIDLPKIISASLIKEYCYIQLEIHKLVIKIRWR